MRKLFSVLLILASVLALPLTAFGGETDELTGVYEGEYDADGKRSGYGVWTYHNFLYEGNWKNDMPNGEGTLYWHEVWESDHYRSLKKTIVQGNWVNGFADGLIEESWVDRSGHFATFRYDVKDGRTTSDEPLVSVVGGLTAHMTLDIGILVAVVPPWASIPTDSTIPVPLPTFEYDTDIDFVETFIGDDSAGTYEGEYDVDGKRSGYGTWTYHNFLYEGNWKNDMPNGEGTLCSFVASSDHPNVYGATVVIRCNWVNGLADGEVVDTYVNANGEVHESRYTAKDGYAENDMNIVSLIKQDGFFTVGSSSKSVSAGDFLASVPPWGEARTNESLPAPTSVSPPVPSIDEMIKRVENAGIYEGEYDADGKRSGFGTWAYYNFLYVGNWENGLPNGEGTLYSNRAIKWDGGGVVVKEMAHGNWLDGFLDGTVEWTEFDEDKPVAYRLVINKGCTESEQIVPATNIRTNRKLFSGWSIGIMPLMPGVPADYEVDETVDTPWDLYKKYPTGKVEYTSMEKIENTGMGTTGGNLANGAAEGFGIEQVGDWLFIRNVRRTKKGTIYSIYKMHPDGSHGVKLYENIDSSDYSSSGLMQVIGDWLFVGDPYMMKADDMGFTKLEGDYVWGLAVDDWEYEATYGESKVTIEKTKLDYSDRVELGSYEIDKRITHNNSDDLNKILYVDEDWVYVYSTNDIGFPMPQSSYVSQINKVKNDGSGVVETHLFRDGIGDSYLPGGRPQIIHGRMYYMQAYYIKGDRVESDLCSVDLDFVETPVTLIPRNENQHITSFHVTEDSIYYGIVAKGTGRGAIMRADLDGSNAMVLAEGFETGATRYTTGLVDTGNIDNLLNAGDWMMFCVYDLNARKVEDQFTWYLMRLDGSDLHKLGDPFVPHDAPGITDSTGKWRYELLADGSAMILGAGSKLKQTGKLSIPATVDGFDVTAIGENAFYGCEGFTGVTIPKSVTSIGDYAFFWCKGLTGVTIPEGVTQIGEGAFQWCTKIKKVTLPASLMSVGSGAFANCPTVKLSVAKKNEIFEIVDGALVGK